MSIQSMFAVEGMTLRDWFAGQALAARIAQPDASPNEQHDHTQLAAWAYAVAQAMVAQRERLMSEEEQALWGAEAGEEPPKPPQGG